MGISIALDDFGTDYSSLTYLWKFPFDTVKIGHTFVMEIERDPKAGAIINTIVAFLRTFGLVVPSRGVGTPTQAHALAAAGCDRAQGYWLGRPLSTAFANKLIDSAGDARLN